MTHHGRRWWPWSEVKAPCKPQKAKALGFEPQSAPLYRLFQAFRRSSPQGKTGRWSRILAVKNNERAIEMADLFHKGDPEYQTDEKWYELVEEEDRGIVGATPTASGPGSASPECRLVFSTMLGKRLWKVKGRLRHPRLGLQFRTYLPHPRGKSYTNCPEFISILSLKVEFTVEGVHGCRE